jgi:ABC-type polysaccharide transport system permease subunit
MLDMELFVLFIPIFVYFVYFNYIGLYACNIKHFVELSVLIFM